MAFRLGISRAFLSHIEVRLIEEQLTRTFKAHVGKPSARLPPAACGGHPRQGPAAACQPPHPAHLERLQPHEARLALLVLEDEEGPPILIKRQRPHGRHGCGGSQRPPTTPNGHPSTSRTRPARRAVTSRAQPAGGTAHAHRATPRHISRGELMWRPPRSFLEAAGGLRALRGARGPVHRRGAGGGVGIAIRRNSGARRAAAR